MSLSPRTDWTWRAEGCECIDSAGRVGTLIWGNASAQNAALGRGFDFASGALPLAVSRE
jgi:hypothetical protein